MSELFESEPFTLNSESRRQPNKRHISDVEDSDEIFRQPTKRRRINSQNNMEFQFQNKTFMIQESSISNLNNSINLLKGSMSMYSPCLYRISIGKVKDLRVAMNIPESIPDNYTVYKIGRTKDIDTRLKKHRSTYSKIDGRTCIDVSQIVPVDKSFLNKAESKFKKRLIPMNIKLDFIYEGKKQTELIVVSEEQAEEVDKLMIKIAKKYKKKIADRTEPLKTKLNVLEQQLKKYQGINELKDKIISLENQNRELNDKKIEFEYIIKRWIGD
jgi:hypothetical protein